MFTDFVLGRLLGHTNILGGVWDSVVVKALRCQSEGLGIDLQWCR